MLNIKPYRRYLVPIFLAVEAALAVLLQLTDGALCSALSFSAVVLAALFAATYMQGSSEYITTQIALAFTVVADLFLVVLPQTYATRVVAMCFFFAVQLCYSIRILYTTPNERHRKGQVSARNIISVAAALLTVLVLGSAADALSIISVVYYANLVLNVILAAIALRRPVEPPPSAGSISTDGNEAAPDSPTVLEFSSASYKRRLLVLVGLTLFLLCDFFVGMECIDEYISLSEGSFFYYLSNPPINLAWVFYVPSQAILALSLED